MQKTAEQWGMLELSFPGKRDGNPFTDYDIQAVFTGAEEHTVVSGFYDGNGVYRVRFTPSCQGEYTYEVSGSFSEEVFSGAFTVTPPGKDNHGPVRVKNRFHLAYADGTPCYPIGTTCYGFALQRPEVVEQTFSELEKGYFNKLRFCVMPKHYDFCLEDPVEFPYEGTPVDASQLTRQNYWRYNGNAPGNHWDFTRFNLNFFRLYDKLLTRLLELGIEADMILFHAYDRWGFSKMPMEANRLYLRYMNARYGAFRNVWWALANEYEMLSETIQTEQWEELGQWLSENDPYHHLLSIHNCEVFYDYSRPWITHCSCQRCDHHLTTETTDQLRERYGKPVIWDEVGYEGNLPHCWGNFTPEELVRRSWEAIIRGGYCGHGECFFYGDPVIWWARGGTLRGESAERFSFMRKFFEDVPGCGLKLGHLRDDQHFQWDDYVAIPEEDQYFGDYFFFYYSIWQPPFRAIWIDDKTWYDVDIIDTWNMTVTPAGRRRGWFELPLPGTQYIGVRLKRCAEQD